ncbi:anti-sigma factor family protein [Salinibacter altiplanensis]|uniref:anti-sigma factor family protein n=1 Tax=Salinibacter altiplanensis TaxID=1803181 RepID=UPI001E4653A6|nr:hypothetical protein [Salinibacter altiplanensis]
MRFPERPFDGEASGDGAPSYEWLHEWLCEYVDGTMDPSVEAVFEQYVEANPDLKAHVERLRQTRELLCGGGDNEGATSEPSAMESTRDVEDDVLRGAAPELVSAEGTSRSAVAVGLASSIAVALVVGFLAGSVLVEPATLSSGLATAVERTDTPSEGERGEAPPRPNAADPGRASPLSSVSPGGSSFTFPAGASGPRMDTSRAASTFMTAGER